MVKGNKGKGNGKDEELMPDMKKLKKNARPKKDITEELEIEELSGEIEVLRGELEECKKIEDEYIDRIKRLQADYDNYRKRTIKEHLNHLKRANKDLISKLLPIIDNFEMALAAAKDMAGKEAELYKGVKMIYDNLLELLKKENVTIIEPLGKEFDPKVCEAAVTEAVDDVEEGKILEILRKGYMIDDFVIRPAVVKVCKKE
jgi:molecular chaperone GrpE